VALIFPVKRRGLLPDDTWKRRERDDAWRPGDTANVSIGQGALLVTPLQMALFTAALANGGRVYRPRLFLDDAHPPIVQQQMAWTPAHLGLVQAGMFDAIHGERGTGRRAVIPGVHMAGKTGTAQFGQDQTHAWMILYAPYEAPRYAVAMIVENDISGGVIVAPRLRALMEAIFTREGLIVPADPPVVQAQRHAGVGRRRYDLLTLLFPLQAVMARKPYFTPCYVWSAHRGCIVYLQFDLYQ
jgi:penicillin-binding protein 2